jgi:threonine dehydrogenase-like Zn-dependent dehydrogenase
LPPTTFFAAGAPGEGGEDDGADAGTEGFQSILDVMSSFLDPPWSLDWHYRSRDERLIAFANHHIYGGRLVTYGGTAGPKVELDLRGVFWRQIQVIGATMASRGEFEDLLRVIFAGRLRPVIDTVMPLDDARAAHERLEAGGQIGKIVLVP